MNSNGNQSPQPFNPTSCGGPNQQWRPQALGDVATRSKRIWRFLAVDHAQHHYTRDSWMQYIKNTEKPEQTLFLWETALHAAVDAFGFGLMAESQGLNLDPVFAAAGADVCYSKLADRAMVIGVMGETGFACPGCCEKLFAIWEMGGKVRISWDLVLALSVLRPEGFEGHWLWLSLRDEEERLNRVRVSVARVLGLWEKRGELEMMMEGMGVSSVPHRGSEGGEEEKMCEVCGKGTTKRCGACREAWYCGRECQKAHWAVHKVECEDEVEGGKKGEGEESEW